MVSGLDGSSSENLDTLPLKYWLRKHGNEKKKRKKVEESVVGDGILKHWLCKHGIREQKRKKVLESIVEDDGRKHWLRRHGNVEEKRKEVQVSVARRSWFSAMLDSLFPPRVLDLSCIGIDYGDDVRVRYSNMLYRHLQRHQVATSYSVLILPLNQFYQYYPYHRLAQRLPSIKCIIFHKYLRLFHFLNAAGCWKLLEDVRGVRCSESSVVLLTRYCNQIRRLEFTSGVVGDKEASLIADNFPQLTHLSIQYCCLLDDVLSIILRGQRKLICLDTRHAFLRDKEDYEKKKWNNHHFGAAMEWDDGVFANACIKKILKCERRNCSDDKCMSVYPTLQPTVNFYERLLSFMKGTFKDSVGEPLLAERRRAAS